MDDDVLSSRGRFDLLGVEQIPNDGAHVLVDRCLVEAGHVETDPLEMRGHMTAKESSSPRH